MQIRGTGQRKGDLFYLHTDNTILFRAIQSCVLYVQDFIPEYAKRYGFEYEYVQYKWPRWLNQQAEKQRTIWGYKILFLDVLFPLSLKKIIFVDTDQGGQRSYSRNLPNEF